jgi:hypothetical protein
VSFRWTKLGLLFDPAANPSRPAWMWEFAQAPATLVLDDRVRVYFSCRPAADANGQYVSHAAYVDLSRQNLFEQIALSPTPAIPLGGLGTAGKCGRTTAGGHAAYRCHSTSRLAAPSAGTEA